MRTPEYKVQYKVTKKGITVDGRKIYSGPHGVPMFYDNCKRAIDYIVERSLGRPGTVDDRVVYRDGDRTNLKPSNIVIFVRDVEGGEGWKSFRYRIDVGMGVKDFDQDNLSLAERVPDLRTRPTTKGRAWPLERQVAKVQRLVNRRLRRLPPWHVRETTEAAIAMLYPDVRMTDIIFGDEGRVPKSDFVVIAERIQRR